MAQRVPPIREGAAMILCGISQACDASSHNISKAMGLSKRNSTSGVRQLRSHWGNTLAPCSSLLWRAALLTENEPLVLWVSRVFSIIRLLPLNNIAGGAMDELRA